MREDLFKRKVRDGREFLCLDPFVVSSPRRRITTSYEIEDGHTLHVKRILGGGSQSLSIASITSIKVTKPSLPVRTAVSYGDVLFYASGTDASDPFKWENVQQPEAVRDYIWSLREHFVHSKKSDAGKSRQDEKGDEQDLSEGLRLVEEYNNNPHQNLASHEVLIDAPLDEIWETIIDVEKYPKWQPGSLQFEDCAAPFQVGTVIKYWSWKNPTNRMDSVISVCEPKRRFGIEQGRRQLFELTPDGKSTRVRLETRTYPAPPRPVKGLKGVFSGPRTPSGQTQEEYEELFALQPRITRVVLSNLKNYVEAEEKWRARISDAPKSKLDSRSGRFGSISKPTPLSSHEESSETIRLLYQDFLASKAHGDVAVMRRFGAGLIELRTALAEFVEPEPLTEEEQAYYGTRHCYEQFTTATDVADRVAFAKQLEKERAALAAGATDSRGDNPDLEYPDRIPKAEHHVLSPELAAWGGIDSAYFSYLIARKAVAEQLTKVHTESEIRYLTEMVEEDITILDTIARRYLAGELEDKPPGLRESAENEQSDASRRNQERDGGTHRSNERRHAGQHSSPKSRTRSDDNEKTLDENLTLLETRDNSLHQQHTVGEILIDAPLVRVWEVLIDVGSYEFWHPGPFKFDYGHNRAIQVGISVYAWRYLPSGHLPYEPLRTGTVAAWEPMKRFAIEHGQRQFDGINLSDQLTGQRDSYELAVEENAVRLRLELRTYHEPTEPVEGVWGRVAEPRTPTGLNQGEFDALIAGISDQLQSKLSSLKNYVEKREAEWLKLDTDQKKEADWELRHIPDPPPLTEDEENVSHIRELREKFFDAKNEGDGDLTRQISASLWEARAKFAEVNSEESQTDPDKAMEGEPDTEPPGERPKDWRQHKWEPKNRVGLTPRSNTLDLMCCPKWQWTFAPATGK